MKGKWMCSVVKTRVIPASKEALEKFTRDELREYAEGLGIERGQDKDDTIRNLLASGKATLCASLGD